MEGNEVRVDAFVPLLLGDVLALFNGVHGRLDDRSDRFKITKKIEGKIKGIRLLFGLFILLVRFYSHWSNDRNAHTLFGRMILRFGFFVLLLTGRSYTQ